MLACDSSRVSELKIAGKHDINIADRHGKTALHRAAQDKNLESLKLLVQAGANVNIADRYGSTALHYAVL